jgi:tetratricopeptide (TPR) repeat protein
MKKVFSCLVGLFFIFCLIIPSLFAEESEKKSDEANKSEIRVMIKDSPENEQIKVLDNDNEKEDDDKDVEAWNESDVIRDLIAEVRRQREEIQALREEIGQLRRLIEERIRLNEPLIRRGDGNPPRRFQPDYLPPNREYRERDEGQRKEPNDIENEIRRLEGKIKEQPDNIDARMMLADLYRQMGKFDAAFNQYETVLKMKPDFDPARKALEELKKKPEESKPKEDFNMGEVILSGPDGIVLKTFEGDTVTFKVPKRQQEDGSWMPDKGIEEKVKSIDKGVKVKIIWNEIEGQRVIRSIERIEEKKGD